MLPPQVCALTLLALRLNATHLSRCSFDADPDAGETQNDKCQFLALHHGTVNAARQGDNNASTHPGGPQSPAGMSLAPLTGGADISSRMSAAMPVEEEVAVPPRYKLLDIDELVSQANIEAGAQEVIAKAHSGSPDSASAEGFFGPVLDASPSGQNRKFSFATLPKAMADHGLLLIKVHRNFEFYLMNLFIKSNSEWVSSLRFAANAIRSSACRNSGPGDTRDALANLVDTANRVIANMVQPLYVKRAAEMFHTGHTEQFKSLSFDEKKTFKAYLQGFSEISANGQYSVAAAVAISVCEVNNKAITAIEEEIRSFIDKGEKLRGEIFHRIVANLSVLKQTISDYSNIIDCYTHVHPDTILSAKSQLVILSNEAHEKLKGIRAMAARKVHMSERKIVLDLHKKLYLLRSDVVLRHLHSIKDSIDNLAFERTSEFVMELLASDVISRPLDDEERKIVAAVEKITGVKHRKHVVSVKSVPAAMCWDYERRSECLQLLDSFIGATVLERPSHCDKIDDAVATLDGVLGHFKALLTERVKLIQEMRDLINKLDERNTIGAIGKRYKAVVIEIDAVKDSIGEKMSVVKELVARQTEYEASIASNSATQFVLVPLRTEIAKSENIEAVNRIITKAAESANEEENSAKSKAAAQARSISRISKNAESAKLAWFDAFSRILTHTNRLEEILKTAFKAIRPLHDKEMLKFGIGLENMVKITAEILTNVDTEQRELSVMRTAELGHAVATARVEAFSKLSTPSRLKAIILI